MGNLVSCVCISRGYLDHVADTIRCFESQTHPEKELIVVHQGISSEAVGLFEKAGARVRYVPDVALGLLRNIAAEEARGEYVCNWDDDDWSAPDRIEVQVKALRQVGAHACLFRNYILWDEPNGLFYKSFSRAAGWESSLLVERAVLLRLRYPPVNLGEDRQLMSRMATSHRVLVLDEPGKYVYRFHGRNACSLEHFKRLFAGSELLSREEQIVWKTKTRRC
jgi:glycosyltransferase involved in cell wall biosynthesis